MRKAFVCLFAGLLMLFAVSGALADTEYPFPSCGASMSIGSNYTVLTPETLGEHPELLSALGMTKEEAAADWENRGVLLQAWTEKRDARLEVTAVKDDASKTWFDLEKHTRAERRQYEKDEQAALKADGYVLQNVQWKNHAKGGNFLVVKYKLTVGDVTYRGVMQKTIRNGYTFVMDYQVFNRMVRDSDANYLNRLVNTVVFSDTDVPATTEEASGLMQFSSLPPAETNTDTFTVEGHCTPGAHLIGVVMRLSSSTPYHFEADANKSGIFKIKVTLPEEGVWLMTVTAETDGNPFAYEAFQPTTYSKTLIPVSFENPVPEALTADETVISGFTSRSVDVQCIVSGGVSFDKQIRTNGTGKFTFKIPTTQPASYDITLVFSKKGFNTVRLNYTAVRELTEADRQAVIRREAVKPAYTVLLQKMDGYIGRTMVYQLYITDIQNVGDEWVIFTAQSQTKSGNRNVMVFMTDTEPALEIGSRRTLYGRCLGLYEVQSEEGTESYPSFTLLLAD